MRKKLRCKNKTYVDNNKSAHRFNCLSCKYGQPVYILLYNVVSMLHSK